MKYVETRNTLVNLANSILKHYGAKCFHDANPDIDKLLEGHNKVCLILLDGCAKSILEAHPIKGKILLSHKVGEIQSVRPATTVACTTSVLTGKYPIETSWMGWALPFKELENRNVEVFRGTYKDTGERVPNTRIMYDICPVTYLDELIIESNHKASLNMPIKTKEGGYTSYRDAFRRTHRFFTNNGEFMYMYFTEPDHTLHKEGVNSKKAGRIIKSLSKMILKESKRDKDTLFLVIADHSLINIKEMDVNNTPWMKELSIGAYGIEGRTPSFLVPDEHKKEFERLFKRDYGSDFDLYTASEILENNYFGFGELGNRSKDFIRDYVAVSKTNAALVDKQSKKYSPKIGHHGGASLEETTINVAAFNL